MIRVRNIVVMLAVAAFPLLAGCSTSSTSPGPTPTPIPPQRLYVTNDGGSGLLQIFAPPFSGASTPVVSFADGVDIDDVAFDATRAYVDNFASNRTDAYALPLTNASAIAFSITTATGPEGVDTDATGNLYVANRTTGNVQIFNAPLSGASTAATTIATGLSAPIGLKIHAGVLYVANNGGGNITIYNPPFTNASAPAVTIVAAGVWGIGFDATGNLWAVNRTAGSILEFTPPFTNASTPALTIPAALVGGEYPALDSAGNLYVSDHLVGVHVYLAPLSAASTAAFTIVTPNPNGIRFGP